MKRGKGRTRGKKWSEESEGERVKGRVEGVEVRQRKGVKRERR